MEKIHDVKQNQDEIVKEMDFYFESNETEIEEEFQKYQQQVEEKMKSVQGSKRRSKWFEDMVDEKTNKAIVQQQPQKIEF